jgi:hypothetical protein
MNRRLLNHLALIGAAAAALGVAWAKRPPELADEPFTPPPVADPEQVGLRSVLETAVRDAFAAHPDAWPPTLPEHLRDQWAHWQRFGPPKLSPGSPWDRYEAVESLTRFATTHIWDLARNSLMVDVHRFSETDADTLKKSARRKLTDGGWLTAVFEARNADSLHQRILGMVVEQHLAWLLAHRDRYPRNPAARHAQVEAEDWSICSRVAWALTHAIYDAMAAQERRLRADPALAGSNVPMKTVLLALGPAPSGNLPRRPLPGPQRDPLQPRAD